MAQDIYSTNTNKSVSGQAKLGLSTPQPPSLLFVCLLACFQPLPVQSNPVQFSVCPIYIRMHTSVCRMHSQNASLVFFSFAIPNKQFIRASCSRYRNHIVERFDPVYIKRMQTSKHPLACDIDTSASTKRSEECGV